MQLRNEDAENVLIFEMCWNPVKISLLRLFLFETFYSVKDSD